MFEKLKAELRDAGIDVVDVIYTEKRIDSGIEMVVEIKYLNNGEKDYVRIGMTTYDIKSFEDFVAREAVAYFKGKRDELKLPIIEDLKAEDVNCFDGL